MGFIVAITSVELDAYKPKSSPYIIRGKQHNKKDGTLRLGFKICSDLKRWISQHYRRYPSTLTSTPTSKPLALISIITSAMSPFGNPLSFAEQFLAVLADPSIKMLDPVKVVICELDNPFIEDFFTIN